MIVDRWFLIQRSFSIINHFPSQQKVLHRNFTKYRSELMIKSWLSIKYIV